MSKRIAYLTNQYPMVSHSFIRREILALERQGYEVLRVALRGWRADLVDAEDISEQRKTHYVLRNGFIRVLLPMVKIAATSPIRFLAALSQALRVGWRTQRSLPYHLFYVAEACDVLSLLKSSGVSHLHAHFGTNPAEIAMLVHTLGGPPYSFTVHGQDDLLFGGIREKVRCATFVVAISSFGRGLLWRRIRYEDWPKVKVVHCGLEDALLGKASTTPADMPRFVCVGRLSMEKGQLLLLEAASRLARMGMRFELVLAGDGPMRGEVERLIEQYKLVGQVRVTGWLSSAQVCAEIQSARALVLPSFSEGLPVVIMEAMALHRPVIATYVGGIPELVHAGKNGWLVPSGSADALADAMADCLAASPERLIQMAEYAHQSVSERHSIEREAAKLITLFRASEEDRSEIY
jgi:colanic acid/amylovoran biosynthesis glycosyltransferase